jgi:serine/threonine protein phosphatase PrpC
MDIKSYHARTDQGPFLNLNEDAIDSDIVNNLYMLLDGFGGSGIGDKTVNLVKETVSTFYTKVGCDEDATMPLYYSHKYLLEGNTLINAMKFAHRKVLESNHKKEMSEKGGASGVFVSLADNIVTCASVGNCLALLGRKGKLSTIVSPDNFEFLSNDSYEREFSTAPLSAFGLFEDLHIELREVRVSQGDQIIVVSDGVYARVDNNEIGEILNRADGAVQDSVDELFALANKRGNLDNQSILILNF